MNSTKQQDRSIAVLGAGISGLTTAYLLKKKGWEVTVYEKDDTTGGVIQTRKMDDWIVETGPNTLMIKDDTIWEFFDELGLTDCIVEANPQAQERFIVRDKTLKPTPTSAAEFITTSFFSPKTKLRLLKEPFISPYDKEDESISRFVHRRLGSELLNYAVNPFVAGVYAGDPSRLSIKHTFSSLFEMEQMHGSITKGMFKKERNSSSRKALISFDGGIQTLTDRLHKKLHDELHINTPVKSLARQESQWQIKTAQNGSHNYSTVISTLPAHQLTKIWDRDRSTEAVNKLSKIEYAPIRILALGFKRTQINHALNGYGFLTPEKEKQNTLGCLFSSSLFAGRAPRNHTLLTCFIGGTRQPALTQKPTDELTEIILDELNTLLNIEGSPVFEHSVYHSQAIPQFNVGYDTFLDAKNTIEKENTNFFISGNFTSGVSVPDCIRSAFELVNQIK